MTTYAFINPEDGLVQFTVEPSTATLYTSGTTNSDGLLIQAIPDDMISEIAVTKRWNGAAFVDFPTKPNEFYYWETNAWRLNSEALVYAIRKRRNSLLSQSDWTQVADAPVDSTTWATYRQNLRDVPSSLTGDETSLDDVSWPTPPA